ncbi:oxidoreductase [Nocardiopsis terrae]|uniref:Thioredoxin reductase n=1 Tax=Nocardiopsis terrae TaxID=372655 RepID=A0ABR9HGY4_9ACTN|nr:NAD(P)/FAD-dependent oxidoreductase [Nocardiopsis terrae]MBE1458283.1 thioredoxin reductase [Nocardiopsis terrae]GHC81308.1 oxidoreductase [Nocardiopsis terrae]
MNEPTRSFEVVVVGGGAAGLSGALMLARARRSVLVIDAAQPRNAPARGVHGYLGSEGASPAELLARGRTEVESYGGVVEQGRVVALERTGDGFTVECEDGSVVAAQRLLVTTGLVDELPDIPGLAEHWGTGVLHCPYCHGWEVRDEPVGVVASGPVAVHASLLWRQWTDRVTLFAHPGQSLAGPEREKLAARGITVVDTAVEAVEADGRGVSGVRTADGSVVPVHAVVVPTFMRSRSQLLVDLGLEVVEQKMGEHVMGTCVEAGPMGATAAPGVWVAGNVTSVTEQVIGAAAAGGRAGAAINADLVMAEAERALERGRGVQEAPVA